MGCSLTVTAGRACTNPNLRRLASRPSTRKQRSRVNLLNWDGRKAPAGMFPESTHAAMRLLSTLRERPATRTMQDRLVWQAASLLLAYPDDGQAERLDTVDELLCHISGPAAALL